MKRVVLGGPRGLRLQCLIPERRLERVRGLLRRSTLGADDALLFSNTTSVHTFGMRFPILVARLDDSLRVVNVRRVPARSLVMPMRNAQHVLECHPDVDLRAGDELRIGPVMKSRPAWSSR